MPLNCSDTAMFPNEYITLLHRYLDARFGETLTTAEMDALFDTPTVDSDMPGYETLPHIRSDDVAIAALKIGYPFSVIDFPA